jgi:hypothetical protein
MHTSRSLQLPVSGMRAAGMHPAWRVAPPTARRYAQAVVPRCANAATDVIPQAGAPTAAMLAAAAARLVALHRR